MKLGRARTETEGTRRYISMGVAERVRAIGTMTAFDQPQMPIRSLSPSMCLVEYLRLLKVRLYDPPRGLVPHSLAPVLALAADEVGGPDREEV